METEVARWIAEFLARQSLKGSTFNHLMEILLPSVKDDPRLMKFLILRRVSSQVSRGLISESTLDSLEMIEEIDHGEGVAALDSMKEAYCSVALDCAVRCLRENPDDSHVFFDVLVRIWRGRVLMMERWGDVGLVSKKMRDLKDELEAALWSDGIRERILSTDTQNQALESVGVFLKEAMEVMGPSFLEKTASLLFEDDEGREGHDGEGLHYKDTNVCVSNSPSHNNGDIDIDAQENLNAVDSREDLLHTLCNKQNLPSSPEVTEIQKQLKMSSTELHVVVEDPLPAALHKAAAISSEIERNETKQEDSGGKRNVGANTCNPSDDDDVHTKEIDPGNLNVVSRSSIMVRNNTARTHEWDEGSISSLDGSPNRLHLRTPRSLEASPLIQHDGERGVAGRRRKKKWSCLEEQTLRDGVKEYGRGNWKLILDNYHNVFEERTMVDLKDKWRNMTK